MPYNTRRKSVSLSLLGIHIPNSNRSSSHRSPPATAPSNGDEQPPAKRVKRSSITSTASSAPSSPSKSTQAFVKPGRPVTSGGRIAETTPPPSPGDVGGSKVDIQGINDDIVVGVINQLEKTGNRPHLLKELAAILQHTVSIVETSANQPAIISSRLTNYMKRPWSALAPCPIGKELVGTHPKRIYFFLNTMPRQAFPDPPETMLPPRIISPSLTSNENESEELCDRRRSELSPSPELDLSEHSLNDDEDSFMSTSDSFAELHLQHSHSSSTSSLSQSCNSPPLEELEREFTQCANALHQRRQSQDSELETLPAITEPDYCGSLAAPLASSQLDHQQADADALFGLAGSHLSVAQTLLAGSSPLIRPQKEPSLGFISATLPVAIQYDEPTSPTKRSWSDFQEIETVELDELDELFACY